MPSRLRKQSSSPLLQLGQTWVSRHRVTQALRGLGFFYWEKGLEASYAGRCQSFGAELAGWLVYPIAGLTACPMLVSKEGVVIEQP